MIRRRFVYHAPDSLSALTTVLAEVGDDVAIISGGTWVVTEMTQGIRRPGHVIDLRHAGLSGVAADDGHIAIGPATTYRQLQEEPATPPLLKQLAAGITGGAQIRNRGTIGGSACYANPGSDVPGGLVALQAVMRLSSATGARDVAAADFFRGGFDADVRTGEALSSIRIPRAAARARYGYYKFKLVEGSWPIVTAAALLDEDDELMSLAIGGAAATPVSVAVQRGESLDDLATRVTDAIVDPWTDALAPGKYRKVIANVIAKRAVQAARNASGGNA